MSEKPWTYEVRHGGLMRCCLQSLDDQMVERLQAGDGPPEEGDEVRCRFAENESHGWMIFKNGAWEWEKGPEAKDQDFEASQI